MTIGATEEELARRVAELLDGRTIATAESCTAGRLAEVLACVDIATAVGDRVSATEHRFTGTPEEVCDQARHRALLELIAAMR